MRRSDDSNLRGDVMPEKPNCYECEHRGSVPGDAHSSCRNREAHVEGDAHGQRSGWFMWPHNFDPVWLVSCDGFAGKPTE